VIDAPTAHRLAGDLLVAHAEHDAWGIEAVQLVWRELDDAERPFLWAMLQLAVTELAAAAIHELAELHSATVAEIVDHLSQ
jgi:hypothetical protein